MTICQILSIIAICGLEWGKYLSLSSTAQFTALAEVLC
jgi:hypothetical protein